MNTDPRLDRYFREYDLVGRWIGPLVEHEDYWISEDGHVIRYRPSTGNTYIRARSQGSRGYYVTNIRSQEDGKNHTYFNHKLVYEAWVGTYDIHTHSLWFIDGDMYNCHKDNLELISHSEKGKRIDYMKRGIDWGKVIEEFGYLA